MAQEKSTRLTFQECLQIHQNQILETFANAAKRHGVKADLPYGLYEESFSLDAAGAVRYPVNNLKFSSDAGIDDRAELAGLFAIEEGALYFCTEKGEIYATRHTQDAVLELKDAGYKRKDVAARDFYSGRTPLAERYRNGEEIMVHGKYESYNILEKLFSPKGSGYNDYTPPLAAVMNPPKNEDDDRYDYS